MKRALTGGKPVSRFQVPGEEKIVMFDQPGDICRQIR
jgi:hypothetical protein